ncbi:MAG: DUF362 domain-containing protein, partial [Candidatus Thorarchaeota archaeon]
MSTKVAIVNVKEYETVPEAVNSAIKLLKNDLGFEITRSEKILLKPNLLTSKKDACTQPAFVEGVISYLKEIGIPMSNVSLGDSPGQSEKIGSDVAKAIGVYDLSE